MKEPSKEVPSSKFCHTTDLTLLNYTPKKHNFVFLVYSYIYSTTGMDGKPDIVRHFNATKEGTDCFDQLCHSYTITRRTNRWAMTIFYGMLDQAIVNARIKKKFQLVDQNSNDKFTAIVCLEKN